MKRILKLLLIAAGIMATIPAQKLMAQISPGNTAHHFELGKPVITNWPPKAYEAQPQNWAIVQDDRGVMYFGNGNGILEYDGVSWRLIELPNKNTCRSLAKDAKGRIFAGGVGIFGYLAPDPGLRGGAMRFVSLLPQVPEAERDFADVWESYVVGGTVYFRTNKYLFGWTPWGTASTGVEMTGELKRWKPDLSFSLSFAVDNVLYIREREKGLLRMQGDSLQLVPGGERFATEGVGVMLPFPAPLSVTKHSNKGAGSSRSILIGSSKQGLLLYDGHSFSSFKTEADDHLQKHRLYSPGTVLPDGRFLLGTISGGVVVIDSQGRLLQTIDRSAGLQDNTVLNVYPDPTRPEAQWLALEKGLARVEAAGPFSTWDAGKGLEGLVYKI
ncbi:MAG TPA: hypothetical protein VK907_13110, partial [Phnomibacter sp.]|nr:hypothetical protein [Phnomibacter sp.]